MPNRLNLEGNRYDRWTVLEYAGVTKKRPASLWLCRCDCGKEKIVIGSSLVSGESKSCGCLSVEVLLERNKDNTYGKGNKGKIRTEEMKKRYSDAHKGVKLSESHCESISKATSGENNPFYGKQHSDETKRKIGDANRGENCGTYKHGLTGTKAYDLYRVRKRQALKDDQTPPLTEIEEKKLLLYYKISEYLGDGWCVDHIQPISKGGMHHPDNLQVLRSGLNQKKFNKYPLTPEEEIEYRGIRI